MLRWQRTKPRQCLAWWEHIGVLCVLWSLICGGVRPNDRQKPLVPFVDVECRALTTDRQQRVVWRMRVCRGGTQIETWQPNATINVNCKNATGGTIVNRAQGNGALLNGMVAPYVNSTIKGAVWYQGA